MGYEQQGTAYDPFAVSYEKVGRAMSELDDLKRKLAARKGKPGYDENVREIEARIAELQKPADETNSA